ncbi:hypothetical protein ElyMa_003706200 [Elysia marginata]|uniref:Secreted protein n=1 Tax=Elysia marginata TaxID=1093978 RepID=A0AAV4F241_9GAST|nr:hypothetical protein ElyMa_003706200 [Elysia marginata]
MSVANHVECRAARMCGCVQRWITLITIAGSLAKLGAVKTSKHTHTSTYTPASPCGSLSDTVSVSLLSSGRVTPTYGLQLLHCHLGCLFKGREIRERMAQSSTLQPASPRG